MKAQQYDRVRTTVDVTKVGSEDLIPAGTFGRVVEAYAEPTEGYLVDLALPAPELVGDFDYENVTLYPDQFAVVKKDHQGDPST